MPNLILFSCIFVQVNCTNTVKPSADPVRKITVCYTFSNVKIDNENLVRLDTTKTISFTRKDSFSIYYFKDYEVYEINNPTVFQTEMKIDSVKSKFAYVLAKKGKRYCYWFDYLLSGTSEKNDLDTFIKHNAFAGADLFDSINSKFVSKSQTGASGFVEVYSYITTKNRADTIRYFFTNKMLDIDFSLSKKLETKTSRKLYKVIFELQKLTNEDKDKKGNIDITQFEIKEKKNIPNRKEILNFIETNKAAFDQ